MIWPEGLLYAQQEVRRIERAKEREEREESDRFYGEILKNMKNRKSSLDRQVGGDHYKNQGVEPLELTYLNFGYEGLRASVYTKVNKYMTRDKGQHIENLEKAAHCLEILIEKAKLELKGETT